MSDMGRRHFRSLASGLAAKRPEPNEHERYWMWLDCVNAVAYVCRCYNHNFDGGKFREACGVVHIGDPTRDQKIAKALTLIAEAGPDVQAA